MKTYLSIDIDFWTFRYSRPERCTVKRHKHPSSDPYVTIPALEGLLEMVNVPVIAVMNHQQMLPYVNESGARHLINVDKHSDLAEVDVTTFECGTWVSYVKWRQSGKYTWVRSHRSTLDGNCNNPWNWDDGTDWNKVNSVYMSRSNRSSRTGLLGYLEDCVGVGICLSPSFSNELIRDAARKLIREYNIPYVKGRKNEYCARRTLRPPGRKMLWQVMAG